MSDNFEIKATIPLSELQNRDPKRFSDSARRELQRLEELRAKFIADLRALEAAESDASDSEVSE